MLTYLTAAEEKSAAGQNKKCVGCRESVLDFEFDYAFQPIVDLRTQSIFAHEALVRGMNGESAPTILQRVNETNRYAFDQACRVKAVSSAAKLKMSTALSINFLPNAVYQPEACIQTTLKAAREYGFPHNKIIFEVTEGEQARDVAHLCNIFQKYESFGFRTAIDDFGAGYSGLHLLSAFQPSILKLDMDLIRGIDKNPAKQAIVKGLVVTSRLIQTELIAEGVETKAERDYLSSLGIYLMQGYYFCRPVFKGLGNISTSAWL
jgi:EAL domain-containing protein (putative c-di-GMP-specific phosphodiesterase class I)